MITGKIDMHMHSLSSDGDYTPAGLVRQVKEAGVELFSLTDHDAVSGNAEAAAEADNMKLTFVPGAEMSTGYHGRTHLLVYGRNVSCDAMQDLFVSFRRDRETRFLEMCDLVRKNLGVDPDGEGLIRKSEGSIGRPRLADELARLGVAKDREDAFKRLIGDGCSCYVPHKEFSTVRAIRFARECGCLPVLAHPGLIKDRNSLIQLFPEWLKAGLMGIEVYYPAHKGEHYEPWLQYAREHDLLVTGGSDFHRIMEGDPDHGLLGSTSEDWADASADAERFLEKVIL